MKVLHYPRLDTIMMVEDTIKKLNYYPNKKELLGELPKQVQYQTFSLIINYLQDSNKIVVDKGKIIWIFNPTLIEKSVTIKE